MPLKQQNKISAETAQQWKLLVDSWSPEERAAKEKRFVRRIDFRLLPILVCCTRLQNVIKAKLTIIAHHVYYELHSKIPCFKGRPNCLHLQDRNALPQARVQGLEEDTGLVGVEYNIVLSLTFIGYILMQGAPENSHIGALSNTSFSSKQHAFGYPSSKLVPCRMYDCMGYCFCLFWCRGRLCRYGHSNKLNYNFADRVLSGMAACRFFLGITEYDTSSSSP